jgi:hypothetical protein
MEGWCFPAKHARVRLRIAPRPGCATAAHRVSLGITGRSASGIVTGMTAAGTPSSTKDGHHNRYQIQARHPAANLPARNLPPAKSWPSRRVTAPGSS